MARYSGTSSKMKWLYSDENLNTHNESNNTGSQRKILLPHAMLRVADGK
jgi:hypothetical protein